MLTQKLNTDDLQFEKGTFDGTMAYAQNKVRGTDLQQLCTRNYWTEIIVAHINVCWNVSVFFCDRDSRWFWLRDGLLKTKKSTSPLCTLAGQTHQVNKRKDLLVRADWWHRWIQFWFYLSRFWNIHHWDFHLNKMAGQQQWFHLGLQSSVWIPFSLCSCPVIHAILLRKDAVQTEDGGHGGWHHSVACCVSSCSKSAKWTLLPGSETNYFQSL